MKPVPKLPFSLPGALLLIPPLTSCRLSLVLLPPTSLIPTLSNLPGPDLSASVLPAHLSRGPGWVLTICALRYICAWLAVRAGEDVFPKSTACWAMPEAVAELTLCARLMSWAAGEAARLIW